MHNKSVAELSRELESGKISSVELTQEFLDRIKREDSKYNSFITVTEEQALADARVADEQRASGNATPWTGVPFAHKDIFCTNGVRTTCGSKMLEHFVPPYDATVTANFRQAGAVWGVVEGVGRQPDQAELPDEIADRLGGQQQHLVCPKHCGFHDQLSSG
ncbi:MAG: amidase family protein [Marinobacter sp.]|nr:amidase family protein [Marinobacter sp.]